MSRIVIETPRLLLREWEPEDVDDMCILSADPRVMRYITDGSPITRAQTEESISRLRMTSQIEMGWWLHPDLWGRGLATEAGRAAVDFCFGTIGFRRLVCMVHPENAASLKVAANVGFTPANEFDWEGMSLIRHVADNPLIDVAEDPRFVRDCDGAPSGSSIRPSS